jgi:tyrosinase
MRLKSLLFASLMGLAVVQQGCSGEAALTPQQQLLVRSEVLELSDAQVAKFVQTLHAMKNVPSAYDNTINAYDWFVRTHMDAFSAPMSQHGAHMNPQFLPWHREFLRRFESEMRRVSGDPTMTVPYWDWTNEASTARLMQADFMGGNGDPGDNNFVSSGPFRKGQWPIIVHDPDEGDNGDDPDPIADGWLVRNIGGDDVATLPTLADVQRVLGVSTYDSAPYDMDSDPDTSFRNALEGWRPSRQLHNQVHVFIAGNMASQASPNDPLFFLHHANIDRIWAIWQGQNGNSTYPADYQNPMLFWGISPATMFNLAESSGVRYSSMAP